MSAQPCTKLLLLGYRATGKTTAGRVLAGRKGVKFIDTDVLIEEHAGKSTAEIVRESGWPGFRAMEKEVLKQVIRMPESAIIACGGGAVLHGDVLGNIPADVHAVWLTASVDTIVSRIEGDSRSGSLRPSLTEASSLREEVKGVLTEREPLYRKFSEYIINTEGLEPAGTADVLADIWEQLIALSHERSG